MKKFFCFLLSLGIIFSFLNFNVEKNVRAQDITNENLIEEVIEGIIGYEKIRVKSPHNSYLMNDNFLKDAGSSLSDWIAFSLGRLGITDNNWGYLGSLSYYINEKYKEINKLDAVKATEWHRMALSILSMGGNPRNIGKDKNKDGKGDIDLIADGTYNRVDENGDGIIGNQGLNGYIFALITLDSLMYNVPDNSAYTRDSLITKILNSQLADGSWTFHGNKGDADMTAMAIQALSPYLNSEREYVLFESDEEINGQKLKITKKVSNAIENGKKWLSENQDDDGGYSSWNVKNCESCVQVIVALSSVGVNIFTDKNFIKNGKTIYDKMLEYRTSDGAFTHAYTANGQPSSSVPGKEYAMACGQALYGNVALLRFLKGQRRLYDLREENQKLNETINSVSMEIENLTEESALKDVEKVYKKYLSIDETERSYVYNYSKLSKLLTKNSISFAEENPVYSDGNGEIINNKYTFTEKDKAEIDELCKNNVTSNKYSLITYLMKINNCNEFENREIYREKLENSFKEILKIQENVNEISNLIKENLYFEDKITIKNRRIVNEIYQKYQTLSEYDKNLIPNEERETLLKCKSKVDSLFNGMIISLSLGVLLIFIVVFLVVRHVKKKKNTMEEEKE